jgi:hypothetical protein
MAPILSDEKKRRRAEASRRNGAKSRGAKTRATQLICSRNSLKHGCYAVVHTLPEEPVDFAIGLRERWLAEKQPETAEQEMLVEEMFRGHLMATRYHRAMDNALVSSAELNVERWEEERAAAVGKLRDMLVTGPAENIENVLDALHGFGHGVRSLIANFEELAAALRSPGYLNRELLRTAALLLGAPLSAAAMAEREEVYRLVLCNFLALPDWLRPAGELEAMLAPANRPLELRDVPITALLVPAEEARRTLEEWVRESLAELHKTEARVVREVDEPARARVIHPAAILLDPDEVKRFKQIGSEYRSIYYRASGGLRATLKDDGPDKKTGKKADKADLRGSDEDAKARGKTAPETETAASPGVPTASEVEITTTVGESAAGGLIASDRETEVPVEQRLVTRDPGEDRCSGNEPRSDVPAAAETTAETPGADLPAAAPEPAEPRAERVERSSGQPGSAAGSVSPQPDAGWGVMGIPPAAREHAAPVWNRRDGSRTHPTFCRGDPRHGEARPGQ